MHSLREQGESSWLQATTKQKEQLGESIDSMGGLGDSGVGSRSAAMQRGLKRTALQFHALEEAWRGVLPGHLYYTTMGLLVDHLYKDLLHDLETIEAISEEESHILHSFLKKVLQQGESVFKVPSQNNDRLTQFLLNKYVPHQSKFSKAVDLLEMPLVKIVEYYKNGLLDEFKSQELKSFILSLFSDSPLRKQLLDQLAT